MSIYSTETGSQAQIPSKGLRREWNWTKTLKKNSSHRVAIAEEVAEERIIHGMIDGDENGETELDLKAECYFTERKKQMEWRGGYFTSLADCVMCQSLK